MIKPREYKLSWPSLYGQDYWILASFVFYFFMDRDFVSVHKNAKKKELGQHPAILTSRLVNNAYEYIYTDPYNSSKGIQYTSEPGICLT